MKAQLKQSTLHIHLMGELASKMLTQDSFGRVLATFTNVIYLINDQDEIFWITTGDTPLHRRSIQLSGTTPRLAIDSFYKVMDQQFMFDPNIVIDFSEASIWRSGRPHPNDCLTIFDLSDHICAVFSSFVNFQSPIGFGIFLPEILEFIEEQPLPPSSPISTAATKIARPVIQEISRACIAQDFQRILESAKDLIGLGEGLTPSGDDFIGGLLFCIIILQHTYAPYLYVGSPEIDSFLERSKSRTNIISYTMLKDHAHGHASDTLHKFIHSLLTGMDVGSLHRLGMKLVQIGHSTGWDLLAGVLTGMLITTDMNPQNRHKIRYLSMHPS